MTGTIDWADVPGWLAALDDTQRSLLTDAVRKMETASSHAVIVETVREVLAREAPGREVVAVVFASTDPGEYGTFLEAAGVVLFADRRVAEVEFDDIDETFRDVWGSVGGDFGVSVDLRTGEVEFNDNVGQLYHGLGYPMKTIKWNG